MDEERARQLVYLLWYRLCRLASYFPALYWNTYASINYMLNAIIDLNQRGVRPDEITAEIGTRSKSVTIRWVGKETSAQNRGAPKIDVLDLVQILQPTERRQILDIYIYPIDWSPLKIRMEVRVSVGRKTKMLANKLVAQFSPSIPIPPIYFSENYWKDILDLGILEEDWKNVRIIDPIVRYIRVHSEYDSIKKSINFIDSLADALKRAMTEWFNANPQERSAFVWLCQHIPPSKTVWYQAIYRWLRKIVKDALDRYNIRRLDPSLELRDGGRLIAGVLDDFILLQKPTEGLFPSEWKKVIKWVHETVFPKMLRQSLDRSKS